MDQRQNQHWRRKDTPAAQPWHKLITPAEISRFVVIPIVFVEKTFWKTGVG